VSGLRVTENELRQLLVEDLQVLDAAEFARACATAARLRVPLERALVERGRIPLAFLLRQLADGWGVAFVDLKVSDVSAEVMRTLPEEYARRHGLIALSMSGQELRVAMRDPRDRRVIDEIERMTKLSVVPVLAPEMAIARAQLLYRGDLRDLLERTLAEAGTEVATLTTLGENRSAIALLDRILEYAAVARASDIHVEPYELEALVRYRIDGVLHEVLSLPTSALAPLVARIKILARLRIDERRVPQDGRFEADLGGFGIELRVSTLPTHWGEKIVMRVIAREQASFDLEDLGLSERDYRVVLANATRPFGMILVTGPTGSGKSTTLYAMLVRIGAERQNVVNISTIEDPVEYTLPRVTQASVNVPAGLEFATGLRALLRQDPDVIMVGEIRDRETVEIAVRSALVGRLLLSTLHTNDATSTVPRLLDMGVEPYLVASTLSLVIAQRLVRRICASCRESVSADESALRMLRARPDFDAIVAGLQHDGVLPAGADPLAGVRLFRGRGCLQCGGAGFRGRIGVFEVFELDDGIRELVMARPDARTIRAAAVARGMRTMFEDGLSKAWLGETTLDEVFRVAL
jgi:type II secretory ATPase GspE/PulE/Tfp pilus assembly ATPase PilB-like protein